MAKKIRRQLRRAAVESSAGESGTGRSAARSAEREFSPDYSYVIKDLKRIGLLAGSFFVVLVVLSLFLN